MDPGTFIEGLLKRPRIALIVRVLDAYGQAPGGLLANGLAFAALFATIPTALVVLGVAGFIAGDPAVQAALAEALADAFPPLASFIEGALAALVSGAFITSLVGVLGLIWAVSSFYVALDIAFARIFADEAQRDPVLRTFRRFIAVGLLLALVIGAIVAGSLLVAGRALIPGAVGPGLHIADWITSWPMLIVWASLVIGLLYRIVPPRTPSWRAVSVPTLIAAAAIVGLSQLFMILVPLFMGAAAFAGSVASAFIALTWLSFTFQALLIGASWVRVRDASSRAGSDGSALASPAAPTEPGGGGQR
jgi:YihY family inner membrane protein